MSRFQNFARLPFDEKIMVITKYITLCMVLVLVLKLALYLF